MPIEAIFESARRTFDSQADDEWKSKWDAVHFKHGGRTVLEAFRTWFMNHPRAGRMERAFALQEALAAAELKIETIAARNPSFTSDSWNLFSHGAEEMVIILTSLVDDLDGAIERERLHETHLRESYEERCRLLQAGIADVRSLDCAYAPYAQWRTTTLEEWQRLQDFSGPIDGRLSRGESMRVEKLRIERATRRVDEILSGLEQQRSEIERGLVRVVSQHNAKVDSILQDALAVASWAERYPSFSQCIVRGVRVWAIRAMILPAIALISVFFMRTLTNSFGVLVRSSVVWLALGACVGVIAGFVKWASEQASRERSRPSQGANEISLDMALWSARLRELQSHVDLLLHGDLKETTLREIHRASQVLQRASDVLARTGARPSQAPFN